MKIPFLLGRIVFGGFFVYNAVNHFKNKNQLAQYAATKNVPLPDLAVQAAGVLLGVGGTSIVLGVEPKIGSAALITFLGVVSVTIHRFWAEQDPQQRYSDMTHFLKNMALLGAAVALADGVEEPWPLSLQPEAPSRLAKVYEFAKEKIAA